MFICCVNKVSHKFCPDTDAVSFLIAVVALKELENSWILVFVSFVTNLENTSFKADGLKQSKESKQLRNSSQNFSLSLIPLLINLVVSCIREGPYFLNPLSLQTDFTATSTSCREMGPILRGEST